MEMMMGELIQVLTTDVKVRFFFSFSFVHFGSHPTQLPH